MDRESASKLRGQKHDTCHSNRSFTGLSLVFSADYTRSVVAAQLLFVAARLQRMTGMDQWTSCVDPAHQHSDKSNSTSVELRPSSSQVETEK